MTQLTTEERAALEERIERLGTAACSDLTIMAAQNIEAQMRRDPDFARAVYSILPQGLTTQTGTDRRPKLDIDNNGTVSSHELEAGMIVAAQIAHERGVSLRNVTVDDVVANECLETVLDQIRNPGPRTCEVAPGRR